MRVRVLTENTVAEGVPVAEHGLSLWIEAGDRRVLFDTGQGEALPANAEALGVDLTQTTDIVLSHGHYDHGGGLLHALQSSPHARVFAHPMCTIRRFAVRPGAKARDIGLDPATVAALKARATWVSRPVALADGVLLTGTVARLWCPELRETGLYIDGRGTCSDPVVDEIALVAAAGTERLVVVGCAHPGVVNMVRCALALAPGGTRITVIGGTHLRAAEPALVAATVEGLKELGVTTVAPCHCTGAQAAGVFAESFGDACLRVSAGTELTIG